MLVKALVTGFLLLKISFLIIAIISKPDTAIAGFHIGYF